MDIVAFGDNHGNYDFNLPSGDILIFTGDFSAKSDWHDIFMFEQYLHKWKKNYKHILIVYGNHEPQVEKSLTLISSLLEKISDNIHVLTDEEIKLEGLKFYGTPWTPEYNGWAFMKKESDLVEVYDKIPIDTDILITHGPPYNMRDIGGSPPMHLGSKSLANRVKQLENLKVHFFGHAHSSNGCANGYHRTLIINCSLMDDDYKMRFKPSIIVL